MRCDLVSQGNSCVHPQVPKVTLIYFRSILLDKLQGMLKVIKGMHHCIFALQVRYINKMFSCNHPTETSLVPL